MRMFCLWLVNQFAAINVIVFLLGMAAVGAVVEPGKAMSAGTTNTLFVVVAIVGFIPAIFTALFAKENYDDMISSGFIRWTSAINLWQGEWKFFFKTLFLAWLCFGQIAFYIGFVVCAWLGID